MGQYHILFLKHMLASVDLNFDRDKSGNIILGNIKQEDEYCKITASSTYWINNNPHSLQELIFNFARVENVLILNKPVEI